MKLPCPHCQEPVTYDPKLAGQRIACPYCKRPVLVPKLQALPLEYQEEYRQEVEKDRRKQEADLRKQQEAELRKQQAERNAELHRQQAERDAAERALRAEDTRRQLDQIRLETEQDARAKLEWNAKVSAAANEVPEEAAITNRYPALQIIASIVKIITIVAIVLIWLGIIVMWVGVATSTSYGVSAGTSALAAVFFTLIGAFWSVLIWAFGFAQAELILLAIDVANDMRINRFLLKGLRYNKK